MKLSDTIGLLLKSKDGNRVLSIGPDQSVYEAMEKMSEHGIGALPIISNHKLVGILSERDYARKVILMGHFKGHLGPAHHDQPGGLCEPAAHRR